MERQIEKLLKGMKDPAEPRICVACLLCFRAHLQADTDYTAGIRAMRANNHELWHGMMRLLTSGERTVASRRAVNKQLRTILTACMSPVWANASHTRARVRILNVEDLLMLTVEFFCELLEIGLRGSTKLIKAQRFSTHGLWPRSSLDLLPYGPAESLASLISWLEVGISRTVATTIYTIMQACEAELDSHLKEESTRQRLVKVVCERIRFAVQCLQGGGYSPGAPLIAGRSNDSLERMITMLAGLIQHLLEISGVRVKNVLSGIVERNTYIRGLEREVIEALESAIPLMTTESERVRLSALARTAYGALGTPKAERSMIVEDNAWTIGMHLGDSIGALRSTALGMRNGRKCTHLGCKRSEHELGRGLHRCASCGIATYCSKECQRADWRLDRTPHKAVCARLKAIAPLLDRFPDKDDFSREVRAMGITPADVALLLDHTSHKCGPEFRALPQDSRTQYYAQLLNLYDELYKSPEALHSAARNMSGEERANMLKMTFSMLREPI